MFCSVPTSFSLAPQWVASLSSQRSSIEAAYLLLPLLANTRVQKCISNVSHKIGSQNRQSDHQKDELDQGIIDALHSFKKQETNTWIIEDNLRHQRSTDDKTERHRKARDAGQYGIASRIHQHDPAWGKSFGFGHQDVIFGEGRHHRVAHAEQPTGN